MVNLIYPSQVFIFTFCSTARDSDESDEIPSDVDLSDPFFSQELDAGINNKNNTDKVSDGKTKKTRKQAVQETEEDRKAKVRASNPLKIGFM